jgi:hypothetical protein
MVFPVSLSTSQPLCVSPPSSPLKGQTVPLSPSKVSLAKASLEARVAVQRELIDEYEEDMDLECYKASVLLASSAHASSDKENRSDLANQCSTQREEVKLLQTEKNCRKPSPRKPSIRFSKHLEQILGSTKSRKIVEYVQRLGEDFLKSAAETQKILVIEQGITSHVIFKPSGKIYLSLKILGKGGFKDTYAITLVAFNEMQEQKEQPIYRALSLSRENGNPAQLKELFAEKALNLYLKEQAKVHDLSHVNVIKSAFLVNFNQVGMTSEIYQQGDLDQWLKQGVLTVAEKSTIVFQASKGVSQLHQIGVVHRDLKPDNILIRRDAGGRLFVKITDFGAASRTERVHRSISNLFFARYLDPHWKIESNNLENRFSKAIDIYQLGMTICQIYTDHCVEEWIELQNQEMESFKRPGEVQAVADLLHEWKMHPDQWSALQKIDDIFRRAGVRQMIDPDQTRRPVIESVVTLFS